MSVPDPLLIEQCLQEVHRMAFLVAGEPDEVAEAVLAGMREELQKTVSPEMLDSLFSAIRRCKAGIERGAPVRRPPTLNARGTTRLR